MFEESASTISSSSSSSIWTSMNSFFTPTVLFLLLNLTIATIAFTSSLSNQKPKPQNQPKLIRSPSVLQRLKSINFQAHFNRSQEPQNFSAQHKPNTDSDTLSNYDNTHLAQHYFFQENPHVNLETQAQYIFEQNHQNITQETQTHFHFEQKDSSFDDFQQTHENIPQEIQTHFDFEQKDSILDENIPQEIQTHFGFEQKDSIFDDFKEAHDEKVEENEQSMDEVYSQLSGVNFSRTKSDTAPASGEIPAKLPAKMRKSASVKSPFGHFEEEDIVEARRPATVKEKGSAKVTGGDAEVDAKADDFINRFKQQLKLQRLDSIIRYKDMIGSRGK